MKEQLQNVPPFRHEKGLEKDVGEGDGVEKK